MFSMLGVYF
jgi:hypothetical protein